MAERRCLEHYRSMTQRFGPTARYHLIESVAWMDLQIDNIRSVLRRCLLNGETAAGLELTAAIGWYWIIRATTEGVRWLEQFLESDRAETPVHGWAYFMRGFLAVLKADAVSARPWLGRAVSTARRANDPALLAHRQHAKMPRRKRFFNYLPKSTPRKRDSRQDSLNSKP